MFSYPKGRKFQQETERLKPEVQRIKNALKKKYDTEYASINLVSDNELFKSVTSLKRKKLSLKPKILVVVNLPAVML